MKIIFKQQKADSYTWSFVILGLLVALAAKVFYLFDGAGFHFFYILPELCIPGAIYNKYLTNKYQEGNDYFFHSEFRLCSKFMI